MKKKLLILIPSIILVVFIILGITFKNEIEMVYNVFFVSNEQTQTKLEETKKELESSLKSDYDIDQTLIEGFTKEEEEALSKGKISVDDVMKKFELPKPSDESEKTQTENNNKKIDAEIANATAALYRAKGEYLAKLGAFESEIIGFYNSAMEQKGMTKSRAKAMVVTNYSGRLRALESEANSKVEAILAPLEKNLKALGADTSIVKKMRSEYESQKNAKLAQYSGRMQK